ncbi:MAG: hypothetical protein QOG03_71 [Actinomycetota bacterium]|nr:hypothetical protein [Actinomycetota bacterium]
MSLSAADEIVEAIARVSGPEPVLVGIDGRGGASAGLATEVGASSVVLTADFVRSTAEHAHDALDPQSTFELWFDWQRLMSEVLDQLVLAQPARFRAAGSESEVEIRPSGIVVVAGPFVLRPQLRGYFDLTVWVEGGVVDGPSELAAAEDWYAENLRPADRADLVVSVSAPGSSPGQ